MTKSTPTITPVPTDMDHPDLARFVDFVQDPDLDRRAGAYRTAVDEHAAVTARVDAAKRRLAEIDGRLGNATGADLEPILSERALAAGEAVALSVALAGAQRRHQAARVAWLERVAALATDAATRAFGEVDALAATSRTDRMLLLRAEGDSRITIPAEDKAAMRERVNVVAAKARPHLERGEFCRLAAKVAQHKIDQLTERPARAAA